MQGARKSIIRSTIDNSPQVTPKLLKLSTTHQSLTQVFFLYLLPGCRIEFRGDSGTGGAETGRGAAIDSTGQWGETAGPRGPIGTHRVRAKPRSRTVWWPQWPGESTFSFFLRKKNVFFLIPVCIKYPLEAIQYCWIANWPLFYSV